MIRPGDMYHRVLVGEEVGRGVKRRIHASQKFMNVVVLLNRCKGGTAIVCVCVAFTVCRNTSRPLPFRRPVVCLCKQSNERERERETGG